jgi:hypothetical protein
MCSYSDNVTVGVMEREGFSILESCLERLASKNSVLEGLSMRRFADIHEETSATAVSRKEIFSRNLLEETEFLLHTATQI